MQRVSVTFEFRHCLALMLMYFGTTVPEPSLALEKLSNVTVILWLSCDKEANLGTTAIILVHMETEGERTGRVMRTLFD